jgi:molybdopterin synthase catalytic subunit
MIKVQTQDFDPAHELTDFGGPIGKAGGICMFVGLVRDYQSVDTVDKSIAAMTLEHYPGMTEKQLAAIETEARSRWPLEDVLVIHRYGRLLAGERIVMVATASAHRDAAFDSCRFLMDWLKTKAPFWKIEHADDGDHWVAAKDSDDASAERWTVK